MGLQHIHSGFFRCCSLSSECSISETATPFTVNFFWRVLRKAGFHLWAWSIIVCLSAMEVYTGCLPKRIFLLHFVFAELSSYFGSVLAEIAYQRSRILNRVGVQLQIHERRFTSSSRLPESSTTHANSFLPVVTTLPRKAQKKVSVIR